MIDLGVRITDFTVRLVAAVEQQATERAQATVLAAFSDGLPDSDGEVQLLLGGLRPRLARGRVAVTVHDPDGSACERWAQLLGPRAKVDRRKLE
jgi:hypothetical protein